MKAWLLALALALPLPAWAGTMKYEQLGEAAVGAEHGGDYAKAEKYLKAMLAESRRYRGNIHPEVADTLEQLALFYSRRGRHAEAESYRRQSRAVQEKVRTDKAYLSRTAHLEAGDEAKYDGDVAGAEKHYKAALAITRKSLGSRHPQAATILDSLSSIYIKQGRHAEAEPLLLEMLKIQEQNHGAEDYNLIFTLTYLSDFYIEQGRHAQAEPYLKRVVRIAGKTLRPDEPERAAYMENLAKLYLDLGRLAEAEPLLKQALAIYEKRLGPTNDNTQRTLAMLVEVYEKQGRKDEAGQMRQRLAAIGRPATPAK
ncbi:MAG: tetratricopeptide repeat protein [Rhodocyclaceae bacterium]|nr:tetratricopeptide repeat protein [Rhodocyclaceae bacterium]